MGTPSPQRHPVDAAGLTWMLGLCLLWSGNYVAAKLAAPDMPLVLQGCIRSVLAVTLLLVWTRLRSQRLLDADGTLWPGLLAGLLFAGEFACIFTGLNYTGASRMAVFVYLAPCFTALGLQWLMPSERLNATQGMGIGLAFLGVALAFADGFFSDRASLLGDAFGVLAGALWGATTVVIRVSSLSRTSPAKTLFYQLGASALLLALLSVALGEGGARELTPTLVASLVYQGAVVAFASYLAWFWLLTRYLASRLATFTFVTPILSVLAGILFLHEPLRPTFVGAVALVGMGLYLVNRRP